MSNKVIFNLDELFISVGIDVGADFSWMSIALPNQQFVGKPYKILHNSIDSLTTAVSKIKEAEELYSLESRIFLESTGIYHYPLFCYLRDKGFNCSVINPIITKNSTNINIRKVHNDRFDSKKAALVTWLPLETLKENHRVVAVNAMEEAKKLGNARVFNTIIIGVAAKHMDFEKEKWIEVVKKTVPPKTVDVNVKAFLAGYEMG